MDIYYESQNLLDKSGYHTNRLSEKEWIVFEDEALFGFICAVEKAESILTLWEKSQDYFLAKNAAHLRAFPTKAWNVYSIFLSNTDCPPDLRPQLLQIEENFRGSRKIVQTGIVSREDLFSALSPLLPIKNLVALKDFDSRPTILNRLGFLKKSELHALETKNTTSSVVDIILEDE